MGGGVYEIFFFELEKLLFQFGIKKLVLVKNRILEASAERVSCFGIIHKIYSLGWKNFLGGKLFGWVCQVAAIKTTSN